MKYTYYIDASTTNIGITVVNEEQIYVFSINCTKCYPKMDDRTKAEKDVVKLRTMGEILDEFEKEFPPDDEVFMEGIFVQPKFLHSSEILLKLHGFLIGYFGEQSITYFPPATIKKEITGKGNAKKDLVRDELKQQYQLDFHDEDQSDSLAVYECWRRQKNMPQLPASTHVWKP